jgi:hypothetical protein
MALFGNTQDANLRACVRMVEDALVSLGHAPDRCRMDLPSGRPMWRLEKGTAHVYVQLVGDGPPMLRVTAPVLHLPPGAEDSQLFRRLLELNAAEVTGAAFGLRDDSVVLSAERTTVDLDPSEVLDIIDRVQTFADQYDLALVREFGGRLAGPSTAPVTST